MLACVLAHTCTYVGLRTTTRMLCAYCASCSRRLHCQPGAHWPGTPRSVDHRPCSPGKLSPSPFFFFSCFVCFWCLRQPSFPSRHQTSISHSRFGSITSVLLLLARDSISQFDLESPWDHNIEIIEIETYNKHKKNWRIERGLADQVRYTSIRIMRDIFTIKIKFTWRDPIISLSLASLIVTETSRSINCSPLSSYMQEMYIVLLLQ